jgi:hypothetical protein
MQKVQSVSLRDIKDVDFLIEEYVSLGFTAKVNGGDLDLFWGKPSKPKKKHDDKKNKEDQPEHKPGQEKTARRLGR